MSLDDSARAACARSHAFVAGLADGEALVYGLTTGCGPLASARIDAAQRERFQRNLVRSHAATLGAPHPAAWVRAAMLVRVEVLAQGCSGVAPHLLDTFLGMLAAGITPVVRAIGGVGASGDLGELAQIALAGLGEGEVDVHGAGRAAAAALGDAGLTPVAPTLREGLALVNGTSFHTAVAALQCARFARLATAAECAAALAFEALRGHVETLDPALHAARPHPGQTAVAARLRARLAGSRLVRSVDPAATDQDPYSLRCTAQIVGAARDVADAAARTVTIELAAVTDNPLFLAAQGRVLHGGNFHGQPVAMALDQLKLAAVELGVLAERRLARLLDPVRNRGLPPFLVRGTPGLQSGLMGLQYGATAMAAENAVLAAPASVRSLPTNADNQDVVPMGMVAARQTAQVLDNVARIVAIELLAAAQALELRGLADAAPGMRTVHAAVRGVSAPLDDDRPLADDVEALVALVDAEPARFAD